VLFGASLSSFLPNTGGLMVTEISRKENTMNIPEIINAFQKKLGVKHECFMCDSPPFHNWLAILQDCLEDAGVPLQEFCDLPVTKDWHGEGPLWSFERGRLRYNSRSYTCCVSVAHIHTRLKELMGKLQPS